MTIAYTTSGKKVVATDSMWENYVEAVLDDLVEGKRSPQSYLTHADIVRFNHRGFTAKDHREAARALRSTRAHGYSMAQMRNMAEAHEAAARVIEDMSAFFPRVRQS